MNKVLHLFKKPFVINSDDDTFGVSISPAQVPVPPAGVVNQSIITNLIITVLNRGAGTLNITAAGIQLPADFLVSEADPTAGEPDLWDFTATSEKGVYQASPVNGQSNPLAPGESFTLELNCYVLNQAAGDEAINVAMAYDGADYKTSVHFEKVAASNDHMIESFFADPPDINENESSNLGWVTKGIDRCELVYGDSNPSVPVSIDKYAVNPVFTETYTLLAHATGLVISAQATVTVETLFGKLYTDGPTIIDYGVNPALHWECNEYATSITISCDDPEIVIPANLPLNGSANFGQLSVDTTFQLAVNGGGNFSPFYALVVFTIIEPSIKTFIVCPDSDVWEKDDVTISWEIISPKSIVIDPPIPGLPSPLPAKGSVVIQPENSINSVITVVGTLDKQGNPIVKSQPVNLTIEKVSVNQVFAITPSAILIGARQQAELSWDITAQVLSIDNGVGAVNSKDTLQLYRPADGMVYTMNAGTHQNPRIIVQSIKIANAYGPYTINKLDNATYFWILTVTEPGSITLLDTNKLYNAVLSGISGPFSNPVSCNPLDNNCFPVYVQGPLTWTDPTKPIGTLAIQ